MTTLSDTDLLDLLEIAHSVRRLEGFQGVALTFKNMRDHGLELSTARASALVRANLAALSVLLTQDIGGDAQVYRYAASETPCTGAGAFGRLGGSRRGQSRYHAACVFASTSKARTYPLPDVAETVSAARELLAA